MLSREDADVRRLLRTVPDVVRARFEQDYLVEAIPHWLYVGDTALHLAAAALNAPAVELFLNAGADPKSQNRRGATPLHYACDARPMSAGVWNPSSQANIIELLLQHKADLEHVDRGGVTALHRAVRARSPAAVQGLLKAGARSMSDWEKAVRRRYISQFSRRGPEVLPALWLSSSKSSPCCWNMELTRQHQTPRARASTTVRAMIGFEERSSERQSDGTNHERAAVQPDAPSRPWRQ